MNGLNIRRFIGTKKKNQDISRITSSLRLMVAFRTYSAKQSKFLINVYASKDVNLCCEKRLRIWLNATHFAIGPKA